MPFAPVLLCHPGRPLLLLVLLALTATGCGPAAAPAGGKPAAGGSRLPFPEAELRAFLLPNFGSPFAEEADAGGNVRVTAESQPATEAGTEAGLLRVTFKAEHTLAEHRYAPAALAPTMTELLRGADPDEAVRAVLQRLARVPEPVGGRLRARVNLAGMDAAGSDDPFESLRQRASGSAVALPAGPTLLARTASRGQKLVAYGTCLARRTIDVWTFEDLDVTRLDGQLPRGERRGSFPAAAGVLTLDTPEGSAYVRAQAERRQQVAAAVEAALADLNRRLEARLRALERAGAPPLRGQLRRPPPFWDTDKVRLEKWRLRLRVGAPVPAGSTDTEGNVVAPGAVALTGEIEEPDGACSLRGELRDGVIDVRAVEVLRTVPRADYGPVAAFRVVLDEPEDVAVHAAARLVGTLTDKAGAPLTFELPALH